MDNAQQLRTRGLTDCKYAFRQHLMRLGFVFDLPADAVMQQLLSQFGAERARAYQDLSRNRQAHGEDWQNAVYDFMQSIREANLLRCLNPGVTLETSYYLYEQAVPFLKPGARLIELACWTGGLCSFLAEHYPECEFVGVDRASRIVELDKALYAQPNISFHVWDYRCQKPIQVPQGDILVCSLGTNNDCPPGVYRACDPKDVRHSRGYQCEREEALRYFRHWREAAKNDGILLCVLRVITFPRFLAFMDAACEAGWTALHNQFRMVPCPDNKESIPSFAFKAAASKRADEDEILSWWLRLTTGNDELASVTGAHAIALYRALGDKEVLGTRQLKDNVGRAIQEELGVCGSFGYIFRQDECPAHQLVLLTISKTEELKKVFSAGASKSVTVQASQRHPSQKSAVTARVQYVPERSLAPVKS